ATTFGPDDMAFRFSSNSGATAISNNYNSITDGDGLHVMRLTGTGRMGLGPTFGVGNAIYATPQSLQHLSYNNRDNVFTQYTNRNGAGGGGTGETTNDGFRIGILGGNNNQQNGNALLYQQERRHLLLSTNISLTNVDPLNTRERMRVTSINAPTELANGGYGLNNPANLPGNRTRVSISHNPANPVTRPLSLLHLGYNTGAVGNGTIDGWRDWMDIGTFTSNGTDNMYVGLKQETGGLPASDRNDAVVSWGDNGGNNPLNGPDNLRFIFTETQTSTIPGNAPATSNDGLEIARMEPALATTLTAPNFGMMGIGDFTTAFNTLPANVVDAKLDIDGDLRVRQVTEDTNLVQVLVIDSNDHNRVHWRSITDFGNGIACWDLNGNGIGDDLNGAPGDEDINGDKVVDALDCQGAVGPTGPIGPTGPPGTGGGSVTANNGLSIIGSTVQLGNTLGLVLSTADLINDREVPMAGHALLFSGAGTFGIGNLANSKFTVRNDANLQNVVLLRTSDGTNALKITETKEIRIITENTGSAALSAMSIKSTIDNGIGLDLEVHTSATTVTSTGFRATIGGSSTGTITAIDVRASGEPAGPMGVGNYVGVHGRADRSTGGTNTGIIGQTSGNSLSNIGVLGITQGGGPANIAIKGIASGNGATTFAGYFSGNVHVTGQITSTNGTVLISDQQFKKNVQNLNNVTVILSQLTPKTYNLDSANYTGFRFDTKQHMGLIAQEVEQVLPNLVTNSTMLAEHDSLGNEISPKVDYKSLNYQEFIPLLIAGFNEQQTLIDSLLNEVTALANCVKEANLCNSGSKVIHNDTDDEGTVVQLENLNAIILDQNLPNPFAEKTTINYTIPEDVLEAQ
ncbi:MAG: tail fiber domain-containing protein, partial [Flavobacteriales bacterium]|nr:tail fiber domain-containing protein [Flavobacteriales bacterium]